MTVNEIFICAVDDKYTSFTLSYRSNPLESVVEYTLGAHTFLSYDGAVDFSFDDLRSAISFFQAYASQTCHRYEKFLHYIGRR